MCCCRVFSAFSSTESWQCRLIVLHSHMLTESINVIKAGRLLIPYQVFMEFHAYVCFSMHIWKHYEIQLFAYFCLLFPFVSTVISCSNCYRCSFRKCHISFHTRRGSSCFGDTWPMRRQCLDSRSQLVSLHNQRLLLCIGNVL
jgi:hypothetical protein